MGSPLSSIAIESMLSHSEEEGFLKEVSLLEEGLLFVGEVETLRKKSSKAKAKLRGWCWSSMLNTNRRLPFTFYWSMLMLNRRLPFYWEFMI